MGIKHYWNIGDGLTDPEVYTSTLKSLEEECLKDIKYLIKTYFNNHYVREDGDPYIKLRSMLGVPCITEVKIENDELKYRSGIWGRTNLINIEGDWYSLPKTELFNVYSILYGISMKA